jgi:hypothetical protein
LPSWHEANLKVYVGDGVGNISFRASGTMFIKVHTLYFFVVVITLHSFANTVFIK